MSGERLTPEEELEKRIAERKAKDAERQRLGALGVVMRSMLNDSGTCYVEVPHCKRCGARMDFVLPPHTPLECIVVLAGRIKELEAAVDRHNL